MLRRLPETNLSKCRASLATAFIWSIPRLAKSYRWRTPPTASHRHGKQGKCPKRDLCETFAPRVKRTIAKTLLTGRAASRRFPSAIFVINMLVSPF